MTNVTDEVLVNKSVLAEIDESELEDAPTAYIDALAQGLAYGQLSMVVTYMERNPDFAIEVIRRALNMQLHEIAAVHGENKTLSLADELREVVQDFIDGNAPPPEAVFDMLPDDVLAELG